MTKEEIREGVAARAIENCKGVTKARCYQYNKLHNRDACCYCGADQILEYLHSEGVVIKSKGKHNQRQIYEAVEPLI